MNQLRLKGTLPTHKHLFKLIQLIVYITAKKRQLNPGALPRDFLIKWGVNSELVESLEDISAPFILTYFTDTCIQIEHFGLHTPEEVKTEILNIINEYWLPF